MDLLSQFILFFFILFSISIAQQPSCGPGSYFTNGDCKPCPKGTFTGRRNTTSCTPCPMGTYNPFIGAQGEDICQECPEGTFQDGMGATSQKSCKRCPTGQNAPKGAPSCISCPAGTHISFCRESRWDDYSSFFRGICYSCGTIGSGSFTVCDEEEPAKLRCIECGAFESSAKSSLECKSCPPEQVRFTGTEKCVSLNCPAGYNYDSFEDPRKCRQCESFLVNDGSKKLCERCPSGTQGNQEFGATKCVTCPPDKFKDQDSEQCQKCPSGQSSKATAGIMCLPEDFGCPSTFFRDDTGICQTCPLQTRYDEIMKKCVPCPKNHLSPGGLSKECIPCPRNMISPDDPTSINDLRCFCKPGFGFVKGTNGKKCKQCEEGTASDGTTSCRPCRKDTFANRKGSTECTPCPPRRIQPRRGSKSCISPKCDEGTIVSSHGKCVVPGTGCPPHHRRESDYSLPAVTTCVPSKCPPGTFLSVYVDFIFERVSCSTCFTSERFDPVSLSCERCQKNEFSEGGLSTECKKCPASEIYKSFEEVCECGKSSQRINGRCSICPKGTRGFDDIEGCFLCPAGTYSGKEGGTSCQKCPEGTFSSAEGAEKCTDCPAGTRSFGRGNTKCS